MEISSLCIIFPTKNYFSHYYQINYLCNQKLSLKHLINALINDLQHILQKLEPLCWHQFLSNYCNSKTSEEVSNYKHFTGTRNYKMVYLPSGSWGKELGFGGGWNDILKNHITIVRNPKRFNYSEMITNKTNIAGTYIFYKWCF